ncbi:MAG: hypothetical protein AMK73_07375 [Planctomycetes bacterium SM23_32]|nr:MAG: hypothetical protein AMK73_07375 [Planctomycetes bacterium SM23_32]
MRAEPEAAKTALSFYCDDTNPYVAPAEAFEVFLDFISAHGVRGEASFIPGISCGAHGLLSRPSTDNQRAFVELTQGAFERGLDTHMELMTHAGLYDFEADAMPADAVHEGLWLHEPDVGVADYGSYFEHIIQEAERVGVPFTGLTWPGCSCEACTSRYGELRRQGVARPNANMWQALLDLARRGRFRGSTVPCFIGSEAEGGGPRLMAADGEFGVYDLCANAGDRLGSYDNDPARADADYYVTADGQSGRIVDLVRAGAPYCLFYMHWQGMNPANGVGWDAFRLVVERVAQHLSDRVLWMRPSEYTARCHPPAGV